MDDATKARIVTAGAAAIFRLRCADRNAPSKDLARACLSAAGYILVPAEMTEEQARRSLDGHALADRIRDGNPEHFALLVASRRETWRQMVKVMGQGGDG
jgi:hypothetical protein